MPVRSRQCDHDGLISLSGMIRAKKTTNETKKPTPASIIAEIGRIIRGNRRFTNSFPLFRMLLAPAVIDCVV